VLTKERLEAAINDRAFADLPGETENEFFDCKSGIYDLSNPSKKLELAKDVSSFANAEGGFLLLGLQTERRITQSLDVIVRHTPFSEALLNIEQYYSVINDWVYPRIENLKVQWVPEKPGSERGFGIIKIPMQDTVRKPFLMTRTMTESGKFSEVLFGYVERNRNSAAPSRL
jgi:Putative DNA-binding domain